MKISEVIRDLEKIKEKFGDIDCQTYHPDAGYECGCQVGYNPDESVVDFNFEWNSRNLAWNEKPNMGYPMLYSDIKEEMEENKRQADIQAEAWIKRIKEKYPENYR